MRYTQAELIRSEIGTVEQFLAQTPPGAIIERKSWEGRLKVLRQRLAEAEAQPEGLPLSLAFRGAPDNGDSMDAAFAFKALGAFVEATSAITASLLHNGLRSSDPGPDIRQRSLRVVDTTGGGFELELPPPGPNPQTDSFISDPFAQAVSTTLAVLSEAAKANDEVVSDLVAEIHPRAAAKVRAFAEVLDKHGAGFAAHFQGRQVRVERDGPVKQVLKSLAEDGIFEEEQTPTGTLLGVLPESREFEARLADGALVRGKLDRSLGDASAFKQAWENTPAVLTLRVFQIHTRTRYVLQGASPPAAPDGPA